MLEAICIAGLCSLGLIGYRIFEFLSFCERAFDVIAHSLSDWHDWQLEDRNNRTIDDLPKYVEVDD